MSLSEALPAPRTVAPVTVEAMSPFLRVRAGAAWVEVRDAEARTRRAWAALSGRHPVPRGPGVALFLLACRAVALLEGDGSRLAQALRHQLAPWDLSREPLRGVLMQMEHLERRARELAEVVEGVEALRGRYAALRAAYADVLPLAWARWTALSGMDEDAIDGCRSRAMLDAQGFWISSGQEEMERWRSEILAWMVSAGAAAAPVSDGPVAGEVGARLEHRYELLLASSAIDRGPLRREVTEMLRAGVRTYLDTLGETPDAGSEHPVETLARQYGESAAAELGRDEAWIYREAVIYRHDVRRSAEVRRG